MACQRCDGLMVRARYDDFALGTAGYEISSWHCLNCGAIVDPLILARHHTTRKTEPDQLWRQLLKELVMAA